MTAHCPIQLDIKLLQVLKDTSQSTTLMIRVAPGSFWSLASQPRLYSLQLCLAMSLRTQEAGADP